MGVPLAVAPGVADARMVLVLVAAEQIGLGVGNVLGLVLGDVLGDVLGELLGDVLGDVLGELLGDVLGELLGDVLGEGDTLPKGTSADQCWAAPPLRGLKLPGLAPPAALSPMLVPLPSSKR